MREHGSHERYYFMVFVPFCLPPQAFLAPQATVRRRLVGVFAGALCVFLLFFFLFFSFTMLLSIYGVHVRRRQRLYRSTSLIGLQSNHEALSSQHPVEQWVYH